MVIICTNNKGLRSLILHTKFKICQVVPGKMVFKGFLPNMDMAAILEM